MAAVFGKREDLMKKPTFPTYAALVNPGTMKMTMGI